MDQLYIKKKSVVELPKATGSISDTLNVEDKITNAPSINLVTQMAGIPVDGVIAYDGDTVPDGYEECEAPTGGGVDINTIVDLLYPIGRGFLDFTDTDYSNWLGLTWERELVGMFPVGYNPNDTSFDSIGETGGEKTHTLTTSEMPKHNHTSYVTGYSGWGTMTVTGYVHKFANLANQSSGTNSLANTSTAKMTLDAGGSQPHNNLPPYQVVAYWKRVA